MDVVSHSLALKQAQRIEKFIENPDSASGLVSLPKKIDVNESITIPDGRVVVHPNLEIDGTLTIEDDGELFIPFGGTLVSSDLMHPLDTIADLRNVTGKYKYVYVTGYHTKNDGAFGSHIFRLKGVKTTETDNGGTVIVTTIGGIDYVYELQYDGAVNVKWFGAKGDGVTDDTIAIQNAINVSFNIMFQDGEFVLDETVLLNQKHNIEFKNAKVLYTGSSVAFDLYTDNNDLDFKNHPIILNPNIVGTANAIGGIRINSTVDVVIGNYESNGFVGDNASALIFRNVAYGSFQGFCESYNVYGLSSNFNTNGIKFEVDGGTTSFGYGYIQGKITPKIGTSLNKSKVMDIQTTQLYNTSIDLSVWGNGYCDGIVIGNSTTSGRMYWCNLYIRGEAFNTENYSFDLTYGEIFGCTGFANINNGQVKNPNNSRFEIYGQYQRTNYGNTTKQINGVDTKLTPLMASFQVEDAFNGKPESGFGIASGTNNNSPIIWMQNYVGNSFRVTKARFDSEPATDDYLLDVYYDGRVSAKEKFIAPKFASYETTFYATASTTSTQVLNVATLVGGTNLFGTYLVTANCFGANTNLSATALITFSNASSDVICPVVQLISQDFNLGSIAIQTYGNIAANTYSAGNGRKCQIVITNGNSSEMLVNVTITKIG